MKAFKAFIKPFAAPQRSVKIFSLSLVVNIFFSSRTGTKVLNIMLPWRTKSLVTLALREMLPVDMLYYAVTNYIYSFCTW